MKLSESDKSYKIRGSIDEYRRNSNLKAFEKWRAIGEIVIDDLKRRGHFFDTNQGSYYFDTKSGRLFPLPADNALAAVINQRYGLNPAENPFKRVLADLQSEASLNGRKVEIRRLAHYDRDSKLLYISRFDGCMYRLDGLSISSVPNGTDDVFFCDDRSIWEPYSYTPGAPKGQFDTYLIHSVNLTASFLSVTEQRLLLKLWLLAVFFGSIQPTRIILLLLGEHGSGKTSALRRIQKFIFGSKANLLSIEKDKQDGFTATVTADPLALFDNLDEQISWLPYALSRLATGITFSRRQLYTTNTKMEFPGVSWLGITSRTVRFMDNQPDLPDRTLVLKVSRLVNRQPEDQLLEAVAKLRNVMWSELLDELNRIVRYLKLNHKPIPVKFRMADFASFALHVATVWDRRAEIEQVFSKLEQAQSELVLEGDTTHLLLDLWLAEVTNQGRTMSAGTLYEEWSKLASEKQIGWVFANSKSLGQRLTQLQFALKESFEVEVTWDTHSKQNQYRFWPKGSRGQRNATPPERTVELDSPAQPEAAPAGFAGLLRE